MKFLVCSLDNPGFLYPLIGIARELQRRGHEVRFVTDLRHGGFLALQGLHRLPRGEKDGASFQVAQWGEPVSVAIQVKHIEHALRLFPADVLVCSSLTYGPLLVADKHSLPLGILGLCTYLWPASHPGAEIADVSIESSVEEWRAWRHRGMLEAYNKARALFRLPPCQSRGRETPLLGDLFLLQSVPELEPAWEDLPEKVHLIGSCVWEEDRTDSDLDHWLAEAVQSKAAIIYVQHGRSFHIPNFWHALVEAVEGSDCWIAASVGRLDSPVGELPPHFFVRPHVPQSKILSVARAAVASANTTAVLGFVTAGIPSLLIPAGGEQPDVAALCASVGIAQTLRPQEVTPQRIRLAIDTLSKDSEYRERSRLYASAFERANGCERATDLLEILARTHHPVLRDNHQDFMIDRCSHAMAPSPTLRP